MGCPTQKHLTLTLSPVLMTTLNYGQVFCFEENNSLKLGKNLTETLWNTPVDCVALSTSVTSRLKSPTLLRDIFVCGVRSDILGEKLLSEDAASLTFEKAITHDEAWERARSERRTVDINHVNASHTQSLPSVRQSSAACPDRSATCHLCSKVGHYCSMCRSRQASTQLPGDLTSPPLRKAAGAADNGPIPSRKTRANIYSYVRCVNIASPEVM